MFAPLATHDISIPAEGERFTSNPLSHLALPSAASQLDGLQDRNWVKEEAMSASLRGTTEPSTWFRCLFSLGVLPLPRSQGRLLRIRAAISGRCLSCVRVPQRCWSLSAANLHRSVLCELLG